VLAEVSADPALVVATPGAEPVVQDGYAAALLVDGDALLSRSGLRAAEEALRRWLGAAALVRPGPAGGDVVVVADAATSAVQALVRWDPAGFAARELAARASLGFPPVARTVELTAAEPDLADLLRLIELPGDVQVLGPVPTNSDEARAVLRAPRAWAPMLTAAVKAAIGQRAAHRSGGTVRVRVDPVDLG